MVHPESVKNNKNLLVFSDDWGRHPSSCQHLIVQLLKKHSVTWVNTIGMRPPRLDLLTLKRGAEKVHRWSKTAKQDVLNESPLPNGLSLVDAKMWPWMKRPWDRLVNKHLLRTQLRNISNDCIAITTIPIVADLIGLLPIKRWIYYCVDDFSVWPGLDGKALLSQENKLLKKVDRIISVSDTLVDSVNRRGRHSAILTHGVDIDFWGPSKAGSTSDDFSTSAPEAFALFWGVIDRRMNADWLIGLANELSKEYIVLAGPLQDPDPRLVKHKRIKILGPTPFKKLPSLAKLANVLIMPYADLPVTRAMQPLKLKEYLATLRPVVTSSLPSVQPWKHCIEMATTKEQFISKTINHMRSARGLSRTAHQTLSKLKSETWQAKARQFEELITT